MRELRKLQEPAVLVESGVHWTREYLAALEAGEKPRGRWGHPEIRARLKDEVSRKCAYCEAYVDDVSYSEVEHIIPKSVKPDLAYRWSNLTSACKRCNVAKGDFFDPVSPLLDPYEDDIDAHLVFLGSLIHSQLSARRGEISIAQLKLNRLDLVEQRARRLESVKQVLERWHESEGTQKDLLADALRLDVREGEFTRSVSAYLRSFGFPI